jgi:hypothetical protein
MMRCPVCKHSTRSHNALGYCRVKAGKTLGDCPCDGSPGSGARVQLFGMRYVPGEAKG